MLNSYRRFPEMICYCEVPVMVREYRVVALAAQDLSSRAVLVGIALLAQQCTVSTISDLIMQYQAVTGVRSQSILTGYNEPIREAVKLFLATTVGESVAHLYDTHDVIQSLEASCSPRFLTYLS